MNKILMLGIVLIFNVGCSNKPDYFEVYTLASPKGNQCLTFIAEYDGDDILKNNKIYLLGYNLGAQEKITKLPDTNYLALGSYSDMEGIEVTWRPDKIRIYHSFKPLVNKLDSNSIIVFKGVLPDAAIKDFHKDKITHSSHYFKDIQIGKYKSCQ